MAHMTFCVNAWLHRVTQNAAYTHYIVQDQYFISQIFDVISFSPRFSYKRVPITRRLMFASEEERKFTNDSCLIK